MYVRAAQLLALLAGLLQPARGEMNTVLMVGLFKYGATSPYITFETHRYGDLSEYRPASAFLSLTDVGKRQMFNLGRYLLKSYPRFFERRLLDAEVYVVASAATRTISAAASLMQGLHSGTDPLRTSQNDPRLFPAFKPRIAQSTWPGVATDSPLPPGWNSFTVHSTSEKYDRLLNLNSKDVCPNKNQLISKRLREELNSVNPLAVAQELKRVANFYGIDDKKVNLSDVDTCFYFFSLVQSDYYNRNEPHFSPKRPETADTYNKIKACYEAYVMSLYGEEKDLAMAGSPLSLNITQHFRTHINESDQFHTQDNSISSRIRRKLYLYSVHEKSILPYLTILKLINRTCINNRFKGVAEQTDCVEFPHSGSNLIFELIFDDKNPKGIKSLDSYYIRASYNGKPKNISGLATSQDFRIPYRDFEAFIDKNSILDWLVRCGIDPPNELIIKTDQWILFLTISIGILIGVVFVVFFYFWKASSNPDQGVDHQDISLEHVLDHDRAFISQTA